MRAFAWLLVALGPSAPAAAEQPIRELVSVDSQGSCLDDALLAEQVVTWLDRPTLDPRIELEAHGHPDDPLHIEFSIRVDGEPIGERSFDPAPEDCAELHAAVGLAMAIALDATVLEPLGIRLAPIGEAVSERLASSPPPVPVPVPAPVPALETPTTRPRPGLGMEIAAGFGTVIGVSLASHAQLLVQPHPHVGLRVGASLGLAPDQAIGPGAADLWLAGANAELCGSVDPPATRLEFCAGGMIGPLGARGRGFGDNQRVIVPFGALSFAGGVEVPRDTRVALAVRAELVVPLNRIRLVAGTSPRATTRALPVVGGQYTLGPVIRFR